MTMVYSSLLFPNNGPLISPVKSSSASNYHRVVSVQCISTSKRAFPLPGVASISNIYNPPPPIINIEYLESEFGGNGVSFEDISDTTCVVKMTMDGGTEATLMLPSGMITSYKARMWHGGMLELLHTIVSETENKEEEEVLIQGGVSLAFTCQSDADGEDVSWSPNTWELRSVKGNPRELIQLELVSSNTVNMVQLTHIVTLKQDVLSSEIVVTNMNSSSSIGVMVYLISHINVSTPEATYAVGLEGSDFNSRLPISSNFSIIPPEPTDKKKNWTELFSTWGGKTSNNDGVKEEEEGEEDENYKHLTDRMSRIYTSAPQCFTLIDRGRRNSIEVRRNGFNELYMFSPGSSHKWYGKYAYICIGQSALLEPIFLDPGGKWRGSQHLHNPNL